MKTERRPLDPGELQQLGDTLLSWEIRDDALHRSFEFRSFPEAFAFMAGVAVHAQQMDHHPDWSNSYTRVTVSLSTHDLGGISTRDVELARIMDDIAARLL